MILYVIFMGVGGFQIQGGGAVNLPLERSKRSGEEPKKLHEFPIVLSEKLPE